MEYFISYNRESFKNRKRNYFLFFLGEIDISFFLKRVSPSWYTLSSNAINSSSLNVFKAAYKVLSTKEQLKLKLFF